MELALVLPLLAVFTVVIAQFAVVARDQMAVWQLARETARDIAVANDPIKRCSEILTTLPEGSTASIIDSTVTVQLKRVVHLSIAGFGFVHPRTTLDARVTMALEPRVSFEANDRNQMR